MSKTPFLTDLQQIMKDVRTWHIGDGRNDPKAFDVARVRLLGVWTKHGKEMTADERIHAEHFLEKIELARVRKLDEDQKKEKEATSSGSEAAASEEEAVCPQIEEEEVCPPLED